MQQIIHRILIHIINEREREREKDIVGITVFTTETNEIVCVDIFSPKVKTN